MPFGSSTVDRSDISCSVKNHVVISFDKLVVDHNNLKKKAAITNCVVVEPVVGFAKKIILMGMEELLVTALQAL